MKKCALKVLCYDWSEILILIYERFQLCQVCSDQHKISKAYSQVIALYVNEKNAIVRILWLIVSLTS